MDVTEATFDAEVIERSAPKTELPSDWWSATAPTR